VATAFNSIPAAFFRRPSEQEVDVLVAADSKETYDKVALLVRSIPRLRPLYVGSLSQAESVERMTVMVLNAAILNGGKRFAIKFVS
jgi:predicted dinucleotide-binding enzyme